MEFLVTQKNNFKHDLKLIFENKNMNDLKVFGEKPFLFSQSGQTKFLVFGHIIGIRKKDGKINKKFSTKSLLNAFNDDLLFQNIEGRFALIKINGNFSVEIKSDKQGKKDIYILEDKRSLNVASRINFLQPNNSSKKVDSLGLMQAMYIYGGRPLKKQTLFKNIFRLGVQEKLIYKKSSGTSIKKIKSAKSKLIPFNNIEKALNDYSDRFIESVKANSSQDGNIVFLSSGWDSTSILATLVHLLGKNKVRAVIGRMKYSKRSKIANLFEMRRAKKFADFFDVKLDIVDLDYTRDIRPLIQEVKENYKSHNFANLTGFNHWILAKKVKKKLSNFGDVVFAGEMSDGAHNFGFSQYASTFHPSSYDFREYSDKMASYLFGPTFLKVLTSKKQEEDPVWNFFKNQKNSDFFEGLKNNPSQIKEQFLKSFFLRSGRIPLAKNNSKLLTSKGKNLLDRLSTERYLKDPLKNLKENNLYSTYLDLYDSFHWQGATVATLYHACEAHNLRCSLPFHDSYYLEFLSKMPESWGRGLELRPTKFPLKWMLENRIRYPYLLQQGAHSYTYDVDPTFSHAGEIVNHSFLSKLWRENLSTNRYLNFLEKEYFDLNYVVPLVNRYISGEELFGEELNDVYNISFQDMINFS